MKGVLKYLGVLGSIYIWCLIVIAVYLNPWFNFWKNAFSDLGGPNANFPWVFNYGLIVAGILLLLYSIYLLTTLQSKLECVASTLTAISGVFLTLIGVFPSGTKPHAFISFWFFLQMFITMFLWSISLRVKGVKEGTYLFTVIITSIIAGIATELIIGWPSIASVEAYGIVVINTWTVIMFKYTLKRDRKIG